MKIFCTGNPDRKTIAYSLPCDHASLSSGWDFLTDDTLDRFRKTIVKYDVFVNSSYIETGIQMKLLDLVVKEWMEHDVKGHIMNIGTTLENDPDDSQYCIDKLALRRRSLELSDQTGMTGIKTTYLVLGGVDNGEIENNDNVKTQDIASTILWIISQRYRVPLLQLDSVK